MKLNSKLILLTWGASRTIYNWQGAKNIKFPAETRLKQEMSNNSPVIDILCLQNRLV